MKYLLAPFKFIWWVLISGHDWEYRTPFARHCTTCGRHENQMRPAFGQDYWDEIYPLAHSPKLCE